MAKLRSYVLVTSLLASAMVIEAAPGYLPSFGPVPLRFLSEPLPPPTNIVASVSEPPKEQPDDAPKASVGPEVSSIPQPIVPSHEAVEVQTTNQTATAVPPSPAEEAVSPQMLLKYFNQDAINPALTNRGPVDFMPPQPSAAPSVPSSSATYSVTPKP
jgi:hypothetical protein